MATDFVVLRQLIGDCDHRIWLCGTSIRLGTFLLGRDPACDGIVFDPPLFETVCVKPPIRLRARYLVEGRDLGLPAASRGQNLSEYNRWLT